MKTMLIFTLFFVLDCAGQGIGKDSIYIRDSTGRQYELYDLISKADKLDSLQNEKRKQEVDVWWNKQLELEDKLGVPGRKSRAQKKEELKRKSPFYHNMSNPVPDGLIPKYLTLSQLNDWWREWVEECKKDTVRATFNENLNCYLADLYGYATWCVTINDMEDWGYKRPRKWVKEVKENGELIIKYIFVKDEGNLKYWMEFLTKKEKER